MKTKKEQDFLADCLLLIEEKLGWGSSSNWHSDVFSELSEVIQRETKVLLSPTTLKRVWGKVNYKSFPSISTLNTLSQFIGFENWRAFKNYHPVERTGKNSTLNMPLMFSLAAGLALVFITLFSVVNFEKRVLSAEDISKTTFSSRTVTNDIPNSVIFDFNVSHIESDSIYIQQYWDATKTIKIRPSQKQATGIYYFPGYFRAKLLVDGILIKEHDLFIKSNGWSASIDYKPIPKYIAPENFINDGLSFNETIASEIESSESPLISTYHFIEDMGNVLADNFTLETTLKQVYREKWAVCQTTYIYIIGSKGAIILPLTSPGCISDINVMLNDVYFNGKEKDLSSLGVDLSSSKDIKINIVEKRLNLSVDDKNIFSAKYSETLGRLVGIRYKFLGAGEIKHIKVSDHNENIIIEDNFSIPNPKI